MFDLNHRTPLYRLFLLLPSEPKDIRLETYFTSTQGKFGSKASKVSEGGAQRSNLATSFRELTPSPSIRAALPPSNTALGSSSNPAPAASSPLAKISRLLGADSLMVRRA
jgi:hypothetical protein